MSSVLKNLNQTTKERVLKYLTIFPKARNSDRALIRLIWEEDCKDHMVWNVLDGLEDGRLTNPESIRRERQKLQKEFPELEGINDAERMADASIIKEYVR
jgi:hypothetical protein